MKRKNAMTKKKNAQNPQSPAAAPTQAQQEGYMKIRTPNRAEGEMFGIVTQLMGTNQIKALCEDGTERQLRIPGKLLKKVWIRENDVVILKLWDFQPSKGDIIWRYFGNQVEWLKRNGKLSNLPL